jgi:hypothetical protein
VFLFLNFASDFFFFFLLFVVFLFFYLVEDINNQKFRVLAASFRTTRFGSSKQATSPRSTSSLNGKTAEKGSVPT